MGLFDILKKAIGIITSAGSSVVDAAPQQPDAPPPPPVEPGAPVVEAPPDLDRAGTFIISDIYPRDLGANPPFAALVGKKVMGKEVVGCVVKASEGTGWGSSNEQWFKRAWAEIRRVGGDRYGKDWFRGCYHFLRFSVDGAKQADYFVDLINQAGGFGSGDLMPWVDVEEGGQGSWAGGEKLESIKDPAKRRRLAQEVTKCVEAFVKRFKERTGLRIAVYGRGVFRDLQMTACMFGADSVVNPAYTRSMPTMDKYGVPLDSISLWQLCGDGDVFVPGFPSDISGWGREDYSVYIDGPRRTTLSSLRARCLAKKPG